MRAVLVVALLAVTVRAEAQEYIRYFPSTSSSGNYLTPTISEDFISGQAGTGYIGGLGIATGASVSYLGGEANHPGIIRQATGASATGYFGSNYAEYVIRFDSISSVRWIIRNNTGANVPKHRVGLSASLTGDPPDNGVYFEHLAADTNWFAVTRAATSETRADTGIAFSGGAWVNARIDISASACQFYINEVLVATNVATIPAATVTVMPWTLTVTTGTAVNTDLDYMSVSLKVVR